MAVTGIRLQVEKWFEASAAYLCRMRIPAVIVVLLATAAAATGLRNLVIDTSTESFLRTGDPVLERYEAFRDQFGRDDVIIVSVEPDELFTLESLAELKELHDALASGVPYLASITSMVNARSTRGDGDRLIVEDLMQSWPDSEQDLVALRSRVLANPLYRNLLISPDGNVTTIALELARFSEMEEQSVDDALALFDESPPDSGPREHLSEEEAQEVIDAVGEIVAEHRRDGFVLHTAGTPAVMESLKLALQEDMGRSVLLAVTVIALMLFAMFRSVAAVLLPLSVVVLALLSTLGLMGHLGTPVTLPIVILPSFLLAVGVGAAVHLLAIHFRNIRAGLERERAIIAAVGHAGLPVLLTSLTTAAGLGSFAVADVAPIADLGQFSAIGVLIALVYTLILLPAGLALVPSWAMQAVAPADKASAMTDRVLAAFARFGVRNSVPIVCAFLVAATVALGLAVQLRFSHDVLSWLPDRWPVHQATRAIDRDLGGSVSLEVVLDTGTENGLHDRDTLLKLDALKHDIETESAGPTKVGSILSVADLLKEIHQALNENRAEFHRIPENPALIPQEFLLFENSGSDDLEDLVDFQFSRARFSMRVPWQDTLTYPPFIRDVEARFADAFGNSADVTVTGIMSLLSRTLENTIHSAARSYLIAGVVITLMMIALIGRIGTGLISMLPNFTPILFTLALMQIAGIPLNLFTMLVGSIAIGLAVDDTVHFMHHFHRYLERTGSVEVAVHETLQTSGRAMLLTSAVLTAGFFIFCLADMRNLVDFGFLTGITIVTALAADFVLAPALMALRYRGMHRPEAAVQEGESE